MVVSGDRRRGPMSRADWLVWFAVALYVALAVSGFMLATAWRAISFLSGWELFVLLWAMLIGAQILRRHPRHPIGGILCASPVILGLGGFAQQYAIYALARSPGALPGGELAAWLGIWLPILAASLLGIFLPLLFPDGRLPSPRWRWVAWLDGAAVVLFVAVAMLASDTSTYGRAGFAIGNPLELGEARAVFAFLVPALYGWFLALALLSVVSVFLRARDANPDQRLQIKWFSYAAALLFASFAASLLGELSTAAELLAELLTAVAITALPTAVGIAVLRYRLYDIDLLINQTVVYGALTAILAGLYTGSIALFQRTFVAMTGQSSDLAIVLAIFVLATVFTPIKTRLQTRVDGYFKPAPSGSGAAPAGNLDDLERLALLHSRGVLTDEEFAAKKRQVLGI